MGKTTFSTCYYVRSSKVNKQGLAPLEVSITINQERLFLNLPAKFNPKEFNKKRKPNYIEDLLSQYRIKINEVMTELMSSGLPITANTVREYLKSGGNKSKTIKNLTDEYMEVVKRKNITNDAVGKYVLASNFLKDVWGEKREIATISNKDIVEVYDLLKQRFKPATSGSYMVKIKTILTYAIDNGYMRINPFNGVKIDKGQPKIEYLTDDLINRIKNINIEDYPRLDRVRDLFLLQLNTGMAYCDLVRFDNNNVEMVDGVYLYKGKRQKTNVSFTTIIMKDGIDVIEKYNGNIPLISNQKYNVYLKELGKLAKIEQNLTSHLLRKTFCNKLLNSGVRIEVVSKMAGHSGIGMTLKHYAQINERTVCNEVGALIKSGLI